MQKKSNYDIDIRFNKKSNIKINPSDTIYIEDQEYLPELDTLDINVQTL